MATFRREWLNSFQMVPSYHVFVVDVDKFFVDVKDSAGGCREITVHSIGHCPVEEIIQSKIVKNISRHDIKLRTCAMIIYKI